MCEKILSKNIKIKLSTNLTIILNMQDFGIDTDDLNLIVPISTYSDLIEGMRYMNENTLIELKEQIEKDYDHLIQYRINKIVNRLNETS